MRLSAVLALACGLAAGESPLQAEVLDALARAGTPLRVRLEHAEPGLAAAVLLDADGRTLATATADSPGTIVLVLLPPAMDNRPLTVRASLRRPGPDPLRPHLSTRVIPVETAGSRLQPALAAIARLQAAGTTDPHPWLWAEQVAELTAGSPSAQAVERVQELGRRIADWLDGVRPTLPEAVHDPVDGGVLPLRLHLPDGAGPFPVALLCLAPSTPVRKSAWPSAPAGWLAAARAAGIAVAECYPAGDRAWRGAAARRLPLCLEALRGVVRLDAGRGLVVSDARPATAPFAVHAPAGADDPAWWPSRLGPARAMTPDPGWPGRPFTIVVGTGEHRFARVSNRALADAFRAAYAQHAQAVPPLVDDGVDPATLAGRDLLCVGNPRSHRLLARLVADGLALEAAWDHRSVSWRGSERLRAASGCLKLTAIDRQRTVLVLDGGIPAWGPDQPLAGLPDGFLRAASVPTAAEPEGPPAPAPGPEPAPPPAAEPAR